MKVPAVNVTDVLARISGKAPACTHTEEVVQLLDDQADRIRLHRQPVHLAAAARLADQLAYQAGLVDLRGQAYEAALYLEALTTTAVALGDSDLADALAEASETAHELTERLAVAVHATLPAPGVPVANVA